MEDLLKCNICSLSDNKGIVLLNKYICRKCEMTIINSSLDEFNYEKMKKAIKNIWK